MHRRLSTCVDTNNINSSCKSRSLQLNASKTDAIMLGSKSKLNKLVLDSSIQVFSSKTQPTAVVRDLGVHLDSELSMKQHVDKVTTRATYAFF